MAGPLSSVVEKGECPYAYTRLSNSLQFSDTESSDYSYMREMVASMRALIDGAADVETRRWQLLTRRA
jgi:hypothetical protein